MEECSMIWAAPVGDTVADDEALAAAHVLLPHGGELHLARRVQDV